MLFFAGHFVQSAAGAEQGVHLPFTCADCQGQCCCSSARDSASLTLRYCGAVGRKDNPDRGVKVPNSHPTHAVPFKDRELNHFQEKKNVEFSRFVSGEKTASCPNSLFSWRLRLPHRNQPRFNNALFDQNFSIKKSGCALWKDDQKLGCMRARVFGGDHGSKLKPPVLLTNRM